MRYFFGYSVSFLILFVLAESTMSIVYFQRKQDNHQLALFYAWDRAKEKFMVKTGDTSYLYHNVLDVSDDILKEVKNLNGVFGNAYNPTNAKKHDTILVTRDELTSYRLKSNAELNAYILHAKNDNNIDPPVLFLEKSSQRSLSLQNYIKKQTHRTFSADVFICLVHGGSARTPPLPRSEITNMDMHPVGHK